MASFCLLLVSLERDGEKRENLESHNVCCEAQLLPGAAGYRAPGFPDEALAPQMNHPSAEGGDLLRPALESRALVDLDAGEELGNDEDVSTTQPGTPAELTEDRPRNVCMSFGQAPITEDDPCHPGFHRFAGGRNNKPPRAELTLASTNDATELIDPDVPAVPGQGTPEIGDCESPAEVPVPPKVPVFDLSQEDEDEAGGPPPPTPAPPISVTAGSSKPSPTFLAESGKGLAVARHTQAL